MIIQKSFFYILARGVPGLISLLAIILYTRLMEPRVYGQYAITMSLVVLVITMCFQWIQLAIVRFYHKQEVQTSVLLSNSTIIFLLVSAVVLPLFGLLLYLALDFIHFDIVLVVLLLTFFHAFFDMAIQIPVARGDVLDYGILLVMKAALGLSLGGCFYLLGLGLVSPFLGLMLAYLLANWRILATYWHGIELSQLNGNFVRSTLVYGLPLTGTYLVNYIMSNSDRLMLNWLENETSAGLYAAAYDLSSFSLVVLMSAIHLAIYPMILKAFEEQKNKLGMQLLSQNLMVLLLVATPVLLLFFFLLQGFIELVLGQAFWQTALEVIPVVAVASVFYCLKMYYFDLAFLIRQKTTALLFIAIIAGILNIVLNYFLIRSHGIMGAAYATLISYFLVMLLSLIWGRRYLSLPVPLLELAKLILLVWILGSLLSVMQPLAQKYFFFCAIAMVLAYLLLIYALNIVDCRSRFLSYFSSGSGLPMK